MPESIWKDDKVRLIGRSKLVKKLESYLNQQKRFILKGVRGVGKTALLEVCHELTAGKAAESGIQSALIDASWNYGQILRKIASDWQLEIESDSKTPKQADIETAILQQEGQVLFVDNLSKATGQKIKMLKVLAERHVVNTAILAGVRHSEEQRQFLWFVRNEVVIPKLTKADCEKLANRVCIKLGSKASSREVAAHSRGLPGRIVAFATAGEVGKSHVALANEEIDISPVFILILGGVAAFRYIGRSVGASDYVLIGGVGTILALFIRTIFQKGKTSKR